MGSETSVISLGDRKHEKRGFYEKVTSVKGWLFMRIRALYRWRRIEFRRQPLPEKVAALIYLDAAGPFAYYDRRHGDMVLDMLDVKKKINEMQSGEIQDLKRFTQDMLTSVSQLEKDLQKTTQQMAAMPSPPPPPPLSMAVAFGEKKYTEIHVPILAFFACPHNFGAAFKDNPTAKTAAVADAFAAGIPSAHVVRLEDADHYVFNSNEADVIPEVNAFLQKLP
ncbi:hypothetical protein [Edaphobacter modestus]|uniref:Alpha/beta hydrolase family protein n=1 Tax=Edaphobacter modestus TaxID=388466 RepID=A0A4V2G4C0_9BACT|nr:hypothetical protein [Edaphobacter modestus]RZU40176.1 hypothetical protein BDD14_1615 [Edaphobacter modestus]